MFLFPALLRRRSSMGNRHRLRFYFLLIFIGTCLGCRGAPSEPLRIGYNVWPGFETLYLAHQKGFFDEEQAPVLLKDFTSFTDLLKAIRLGRLEGAAVSLNEMLLSRLGTSYRVVLALDESFGSDGIVGQSRIESIKDLKQKRVGVELNGLGAYVLTRALQKSGLSMSDVIPVHITPHEEAYSAFVEKEVDAVVTFEPILSRLIRERKANLLFTSREIPAEIIGVLIFREDVLENRREDCVKVVKAYFKAIDFWKKRPEEATAIMAKREQVSPDQFRRSLKGILIPDFSANYILFGLNQTENYFSEAVKHFQSFMEQNNLAYHEVLFEDLLSGLKESHGETF